MRRRILVVSVLAVLVAILSQGNNFAITEEELYSGIQFNFSNPGARATGIGGAFIALADDATASIANPAGLVILTKPEIAVEFKNIGYETSHLFDSVDDDIAFTTSPVYRDFDNDVSTLSFLNFTYPTKYVTYSVYMQQLMDYEHDFFTNSPASGYYDIDLDGTIDSKFIFFPVDAELESEITAYGVSAAFKLNEKFSAGISLRLLELDFNQTISRYDLYSSFTPANLFRESRISDSDSDFNFNIGLLWKPTDIFSLGAVYRKGSSFEIEEIITNGPVHPDPGATRTEPFSFSVPDVYGIGFALRPLDKWTFSLDIVSIEYSDLLEGFNVELSRLRPQDHDIDDAVEYHFGVEYVVLARTVPIALRAGYYMDPDHSLQYKGNGEFEDPSIPTNSEIMRLERDRGRLLFPEGDDEGHTTLGIGFVFGDFQLDIAGDLSDRGDSFIGSFVYRF